MLDAESFGMDEISWPGHSAILRFAISFLCVSVDLQCLCRGYHFHHRVTEATQRHGEELQPRPRGSRVIKRITKNSEGRQRLSLQSECLRILANDRSRKKTRHVINVLLLEIRIELVALLGQRANAALSR